MLRTCVGIVLLCLVISAPALARENSDHTNFYLAFDSCLTRPCVIRVSNGGILKTFTAAANEVNKGWWGIVVIDGPCYSACVIFADKARWHVCITSRAVFGLHKERVYDNQLITLGPGGSYSAPDGAKIIGYEDPEQSPFVTHWVKRNGGYPIDTYRVMPYKVAKYHWRTC